ncbi:MAG TPA: hypothetical protein PKC41_13585, partial [Chitinophagaceae bacterium]|nr:hypothetical protein [Chitinophagaceae bacterium]
IPHLPVNFELLKKMNNPIVSIDSMIAYKPGFESILDQESFFKRLWGTMGKQVYYGTDKKLGKL